MLELQRLSGFISGIHQIDLQSDQQSKLESQYEQEGFTVIYKNKIDGMTNFVFNHKSINKNLQSLKQLFYNQQNEFKKQYKLNLNYFQHSNTTLGLVRQFLFKFPINQKKKWRGVLLYQFFLNKFKEINQQLFTNNRGIKISVEQLQSCQQQIITVKFQSWLTIDQWRFQLNQNCSYFENQFKIIDKEINFICDDLKKFQNVIDEIEKQQQSSLKSDEFDLIQKDAQFNVMQNINLVFEQSDQSENQIYFQYDNSNDLLSLKNIQKIKIGPQQQKFYELLKQINECSFENQEVYKLLPEHFYDRNDSILYVTQLLNQSDSFSFYLGEKRKELSREKLLKIVLILLRFYLLQILLVEQNINYLLFYDNMKRIGNEKFRINLEEFYYMNQILKQYDYEIKIDFKKLFQKINFRIFQILQNIIEIQGTDLRITQDIINRIQLKLFYVLEVFEKNQKENQNVKQLIEEAMNLLKKVYKSNTILNQI